MGGDRRILARLSERRDLTHRATLRCGSRRGDDRLGGRSQRRDLPLAERAQLSLNGVSDLVMQRAHIDSAVAHGVG